MFSYVDHSSLECYGEGIDNRRVTMALEFYELPVEKALLLCNELLCWIEEAQGGCYTTAWSINNRSVGQKNLADKVRRAIIQNGAICLSSDAFVQNDWMSCPKSVRDQLSTMQRSIFPKNADLLFYPGSFPHYWKQTFPSEYCSPQNIKQFIEKLFLNKECIQIERCTLPDMCAHLLAVHYEGAKDRFYGSFSISVSAFCIDNHICEIADSFCSKMEQLSKAYQNINARTMLQPYTIAFGKSPYMHYFGQCRNSDGSHQDAGQTPDEWYYTYYMCGVEWANIISPRTRQHVPNIMAQALSTQSTVVKEIASGAILLKSNKTILAYDVDDAITLKKLVIDALYPGGSDYLIRDIVNPNKTLLDWKSLPRHDWAIVPVLDGEIDILGTRIIFRSKNFW